MRRETLSPQLAKEQKRLNKMEANEQQVDHFDSDERHDDTAEAPNEQVAAQQCICTDWFIRYAFECNRDQQWDDDRVEDYRRENRGRCRVQIHDVERF